MTDGPADSGLAASVVIPTKDRETRLAFALEALAAQSLDRGRFEVVVVRAPHPAGTALCESPAGLNVRFLDSPVAAPAAQRNLGWRAASAQLVAFTDDDCRPSAQWLEALVNAAGGDKLMLQGRTEPDPDEEHLYWGLARSWSITRENGWYATCNMAYPRALLERVGGFDEAFPAAWGEDTDLGLRARGMGARQRYVDEALTWHAVLPRSLPAALREARRRDATVTVVARHPEHRSELHRGYFAQVARGFHGVATDGPPIVPLDRNLPEIARTRGNRPDARAAGAEVTGRRAERTNARDRVRRCVSTGAPFQGTTGRLRIDPAPF